MRRLWWLAFPGFAIVVWASIALGSYVYLSGMGFADEFAFPWDQLPMALSYIVDDGWHGMGTLRIWNCAAGGVIAMIALPILCGWIVVRVGFRWIAAPSLYGKTAWADRQHMQDRGISTDQQAL